MAAVGVVAQEAVVEQGRTMEVEVDDNDNVGVICRRGGDGCKEVNVVLVVEASRARLATRGGTVEVDMPDSDSDRSDCCLALWLLNQISAIPFYF